MQQIFISHSNHDAQIAKAVQDALECDGHRCWIAPRDIQAGQSWAAAVLEAIEASQVMVVIVTLKANESRQVVREIERAVAKGVTILPFRTENFALTKEFEYFLSAAHWFDATTMPLEPHLAELSKTLTATLQSQPPQPHVSKTKPSAAGNRLRRALGGCLALVAAIVGISLWRPWDTTTTVPTPPARSPGSLETRQTGKPDTADEDTDTAGEDGKDGQGDGKYPAELVQLKAQAQVAAGRVKTLDRGQGFAGQLDASSTMLETGDEFYRQRSFDDATRSYQQFLLLCEDLKFKQRQRQATTFARDKALAARKQFTGYPIHSLFDSYHETAAESLRLAAADFEHGEFYSAELSWRAAERRFEDMLALCSANDELRKAWVAMYNGLTSILDSNEELGEKIDEIVIARLTLLDQKPDKKAIRNLRRDPVALDFDNVLTRVQHALSYGEPYGYMDLVVHRALLVSYQQAKEDRISQRLAEIEMILENERFNEARSELEQVNHCLMRLRSSLVIETYRDGVTSSWVADLSGNIENELLRVRSILRSYDSDSADTLKLRVTRLVDDASRIPQTQHVGEVLSRAKSYFDRASMESPTDPLKHAIVSYGSAIESALDDAHQLSIRTAERNRNSLQDAKLRGHLRERMLGLATKCMSARDQILAHVEGKKESTRQHRLHLTKTVGELRFEMDKAIKFYLAWGDPSDEMIVKDDESMVLILGDELDDIVAAVKSGETGESVARGLKKWGDHVLRAADFLNPIGPPESGFEL